jgi:hypothetical protein
MLGTVLTQPSTSSGTPGSPGRPNPRVVESARVADGARAWWTNHALIDWPAGVLLGLALHEWALPYVPLDRVDPAIRFAAYVALGSSGLAFVTIAFTPLAIMVALSGGRNLRRLRAHDPIIRRQFLLGTLVVLGTAATLVMLGVADSTKQGSPDARVAAVIIISVAALKVVRLTQLFWAILAAISKDSGAT